MAQAEPRSVTQRGVLALDRAFDQVRRRVRDRLGRHAPLEVVPYRGYGTADRVAVRGRVMVRTGRTSPAATDVWLRNVWRTVRRFLTYEMPDVAVRVRMGTAVAATRTDGEGYFRVDMPGPSATGWVSAGVEVERAALVAAEILVPPPTSRFLVVSDIDDTILPTGANRTTTVIRTTLLGNARTRAPFTGIAELYQALAAGQTGDERNPVFYVSSSPWNLYDFMVEFMAGHGLPAGPILLRDLSLERRRFIQGGQEDHKLAEIRTILATYPELPAVLVGDIGQKDPEIYQAIASEHPGRIRAIYLRDVGAGAAIEQRALAIEGAAGVPVVLAEHTSEFRKHAATVGLIAGQR